MNCPIEDGLDGAEKGSNVECEDGSAESEEEVGDLGSGVTRDDRVEEQMDVWWMYCRWMGVYDPRVKDECHFSGRGRGSERVRDVVIEG